MDISVTDFNILLYNYAVVLSGGYVTMQLQIDSRGILFGFTFIFAVIWTVYFRLDMVSRVTDAGNEGAEE